MASARRSRAAARALPGSGTSRAKSMSAAYEVRAKHGTYQSRVRPGSAGRCAVPPPGPILADMTSTWFRIGASVLLAAGWGAAAALWTPRGPLTNAQALWSIVISAAVGLAAGRVTRSRWAIITTPLAYAAALELTRLPVTGPSVDAPHLSAFGLVALLSGRGVHGL